MKSSALKLKSVGFRLKVAAGSEGLGFIAEVKASDLKPCSFCAHDITKKCEAGQQIVSTSSHQRLHRSRSMRRISDCDENLLRLPHRPKIHELAKTSRKDSQRQPCLHGFYEGSLKVKESFHDPSCLCGKQLHPPPRN